MEGEYEGQPVNFGMFDSFHRVYEDLVKHSPRCARLCCTGIFIVEAMLKVEDRGRPVEIVWTQLRILASYGIICLVLIPISLMLHNLVYKLS